MLGELIYDVNTLRKQREKKMLSLEQVRKVLAVIRLTKMAEDTGLSYNTLREIRDNEQANPSYRTMKAVSDYLENL